MPPLPLATLDLLESAGLVSLLARDPDVEYGFKHSLVQETAYESLLRPRRVELHRKVAEAIEGLGEASGVDAAVLAIHFKEAGLPDKAFRYSAEAGDRGRDTYAHAEALANYDLALSVADQLDRAGLAPRLRRVYASRGSILEVMGQHQEALENYEAMRRQAARLEDPAMQADALNRLATVQAVTFKGGDAETLLNEALGLAEKAKDLPMIARTLWNHGLFFRFHEPEKATGYFQKALDIVQRPDCQQLGQAAGILELEGFILADLRVTQVVAGQYRAGAETGRRALEVFRGLGNKAMIADCLAGAAMIALYSGRPEEAARLSDEGREISRSIGNPWGLVYNSWHGLELACERARFDEARDQATALLPMAHQVSFPIFVGMIESILTRIYIAGSMPQVALEHAQASLVPFTSQASQVSWGIWGQGTMGMACLALGDLEEAGKYIEPIFKLHEGVVRGFQGYFVAAAAVLQYALLTRQWERGLAFADWILERTVSEGLRRVEADVLHWRGRLRLASGRHEQARHDFVETGERIAAIGYLALEWQNDFFHAAALDELGHREDGSGRRAHAHELADALVQGLQAPDLREGYARTVSAVLGAHPF
jgi:tetratricopeptide (TPR) repeat protein